MILIRHIGGTIPRSRHFLRAWYDAPRRSPASLIKSQSFHIAAE
jgi:DNA-binding XRE family transcriptional regulator